LHYVETYRGNYFAGCYWSEYEGVFNSYSDSPREHYTAFQFW